MNISKVKVGGEEHEAVDLERKYVVSEDLLKRLIEVLGDHMFSDCGEYNNNDVIDMKNEIEGILGE